MAVTNTELAQLEKHTEGGKANMCQAIEDMLKDAHQAGRQENEDELREARREAQEARQSMKEAALRMRDAEFPIHQIATLLNQPERLIREWFGGIDETYATKSSETAFH